jgi:hypothetical protein
LKERSVNRKNENKIEKKWREKTHRNDFNPNLNSCHLSKFAEIFDVGLGLSGGRGFSGGCEHGARNDIPGIHYQFWQQKSILVCYRIKLHQKNKGISK